MKSKISYQKHENFQKNTEEIKTLQGIIPMCTSCKNIRDGKGYWNHKEAYIRELSIINFNKDHKK
jgi:hypothetical protein